MCPIQLRLDNLQGSATLIGRTFPTFFYIFFFPLSFFDHYQFARNCLPNARFSPFFFLWQPYFTSLRSSGYALSFESLLPFLPNLEVSRRIVRKERGRWGVKRGKCECLSSFLPSCSYSPLSIVFIHVRVMTGCHYSPSSLLPALIHAHVSLSAHNH